MAILVPITEIIKETKYTAKKLIYDLANKTFIQELRGPMNELKEIPISKSEALAIIGETKEAEDIALLKIDGSTKVEAVAETPLVEATPLEKVV